MRQFYIVVLLFLWTSNSNYLLKVSADEGVPIIDENKNASSPTAEDEDEQHRTFPSQDNINVHVLSNFLPHDLAVKWRNAMKQEWFAGASSSPSCDPADGGSTSCSACRADPAATSSAWRYATNNDGSSIVDNNAKVRSMENIDSRNATAQQMRNADLFSYSKWELDPSHSLVKEMEDAFKSQEMRTRFAKHILKDPTVNLSPELSDLFVTLYSTGDFLSPHNDGMAGKWAFVVSLMDGPDDKEWQGDEFGGTLRFECPFTHAKYQQPLPAGKNVPTRQWCETLTPSFNTAIVFQSMTLTGAGPMHEVLPVKSRAEIEGFRRFGITGWYMDVTDVMPESIRAERDKMRAK
jgi:Rps23 Pro-64 3,4-dihydroxylase Tpa1-like proline 4-hydroxylase